ncbi:hypothetical protein ColLi_13271 [Colletotrichum liriopes]|uniref:Uncharacterized protein n=1 Tax=Colletotrichum liriopes TaxID=708192 RepID=A0AA37M0G9_9PEZI|nr:hypothetical protein ColLi_13271 [Colletotrichum liriopes]
MCHRHAKRDFTLLLLDSLDAPFLDEFSVRLDRLSGFVTENPKVPSLTGVNRDGFAFTNAITATIANRGPTQTHTHTRKHIPDGGHVPPDVSSRAGAAAVGEHRGDRRSFRFRSRTLGELVFSSPSTKVTWRPSDKVLMKSFLAFYRLSPASVDALRRAATSSAGERVLAAARQPDPVAADLHQLAVMMDIDLPSLSDAEWDAIKTKMASSLAYILDKNVRAGRLEFYWDLETMSRRLRWPRELREAWLHPLWLGDDDATTPPAAVAVVPVPSQGESRLPLRSGRPRPGPAEPPHTSPCTGTPERRAHRRPTPRTPESPSENLFRLRSRQLRPNPEPCPPPLPSSSPHPGAHDAQEPVAEALIRAIRRYDLCSAEVSSISINEMATRCAVHELLVAMKPPSNGRRRQQHLTDKLQWACTRALIRSLVVVDDGGDDHGDGEPPPPGQCGPLRRLTRLQNRRREVLVLMRDTAAIIGRLQREFSNPQRGEGMPGVWQVLWEPAVLCTGLVGQVSLDVV